MLAGGCHATFVDERSGPASAGTSLDGVDLGAGTPLGAGSFVGRAGHVAFGGVGLYGHGDLVEVRFGDDFYVSDVPGPVVVLSPRDSLGTALDPVAGDLEIATLLKPTGAQAYAAQMPSPLPPNLFIFCKPYGLEVGKATVGP